MWIAAKTILTTILVVLAIIFIIVCMTGSACAQNERPVTFNEHPQHAQYVILPWGGSTFVASGEQTSGFPTPSPALPISLGEVARRNKVEHQNEPKATICWEGNDGLTCRIPCDRIESW